MLEIFKEIYLGLKKVIKRTLIRTKENEEKFNQCVIMLVGNYI